ncbi:MAG TPA: hypothetical protein VI503_02595 [Gaiellaceae bacterium]|nr:hypothetical protein [Gaiellaceae bacterium]
MAVACFVSWPGMTSDQYDSVMAGLDLDANPAAGLVLHLAAVTDDGVEVCDIWQTEQAFRGYVERRLQPLAQSLEIAGEPQARVVPLRNLYAADGLMIDRIGAVSLPAMVAEWAR